ncbi:MAG: 50S ribosomal protein L3 [Planctomycetes bacterium]|nr:50S ribosomal protein L3 [Planctomycetota bacterium]MCB9910363.1 50S ribosomal protein L3 [Planctomycetota bacterium]MCB9912026.1 50S ribosomal protein L3 [Planctomycetota bacterium]HRV80622.1 50S ribosomal protein L3 [Planctomycetota bacterium]
MTLILGRKIGMTQYFAEDGTIFGCTVLEAGPCVVMQVRTPERDGYHALQWGFEDVKESRARKPQRVEAAKRNLAPKRVLREERLAAASDKNVGDVRAADAFEVGDLVDVAATTKGRGFAGTIKRHGFQRGPKTHGSMNYRRPGSIGSSAYPARVIKGKRMSGHYGAKRHTTKNLQVVRIDNERGLLFVRGAVPGHRGSLVEIKTARTGVKKG